ncbi:MAG: DNA primase [Kiritimatiellia bacterium]|jgi:DNA primase
MARRVTAETLEEIRQRIDIVDLIGSRITLKRSGSTFKARCPFHKEKTPSFHVNPVRRTYHCFGCGAHGDIFKFLMESDGMTFMDAVRTLAERAMVPLDTQVDYEAASRKALYTLHDELAAFYQRCLRDHSSAGDARRYLASRKLDSVIVERFGIGYAPRIARTLERWAAKHGYDIEQLVTAGLLVPPREIDRADDYYDRFRGRLMFPIRDATGRVVGFSGRILDPKASPAKYVNSPETPIFQKGRILYALDLARASIVRHPRREAILCEGQIDVIRCHACGFDTAVAAQGTAFTEEHARLLKRYADSVVLVYDGDAAGRKAAVRTGQLLLAAGLPVRAVLLAEDQDPDSLLRDQGPEGFQQLIDQAESITAFQIATLQAQEPDPTTVDAIARISGQVLELLVDCPKAVLRSHLLQEAAVRLGLPVSALEEDLEKAISRRQAAVINAPSPAPAARAVPAHPADDLPPDVMEPLPPRGAVQASAATAVPKPSAAARPRHSPAFSLCALLLHHAEDAEAVDLVRTWLPPVLIEEEPARIIISAAIEGHELGEDRLSKLATEGTEEVQRWIAQLARRDVPLLYAQNLTPADAAADMVARIWIDHLRRERQSLDNEDAEQETRRFTLTRLIKALEQNVPWPKRSAGLVTELPKYMGT